MRYQVAPYKKIFNIINGLHSYLVLILLLTLLLWGMIRSPYFSIQQIEVSGDLKHLSMDVVVEVSKISLGTNLFSVSLHETEKNVLKLPWVQSVSIRRQVPDTLWIYVKEYRPIALLLEEQLYFVSQGGVVFKKVEEEVTRDLPVITGLKKEDRLDEVVQLLKIFNKSDDFRLFGLSEIHYNDVTGFSVVTLMGPMEIRLGRDHFENKLKRLQQIWTKLDKRYARVHGIDLDYEDRAFVKL